jgi:AcrR family transcriptional regulator
MTFSLSHGSGTRKRVLDAAEHCFIAYGYEAMSLRQITDHAKANLAAVRYHFGSKEMLIQALLSQKLDRLNRERLELLDACERQWPQQMDTVAILSILLAPAFRLSHEGANRQAFLQLLGRAYSDQSPFVISYMNDHYEPIFQRFFEAFARALPGLPRAELSLRLHFGLKVLSDFLRGEDMQQIIRNLDASANVGDANVLARLISLVAPVLTAPMSDQEQMPTIERVMHWDRATTLTRPTSSSGDSSKRLTELRSLERFQAAQF